VSAGRRLRVAVIGVGHLGRVHARIYRENARAELVGVSDRDEARARAVAGELGCAAFAGMEDLPEGLDAVSVVVPTVQHASVAVPLLERGVACLVEKPIAPSVAEAEAIQTAARRGRTALAVGHVERFQPGVRRVKELGIEPRFIEAHRLAAFSFRSIDVGVVHDLMIHDLDLVLHLVGSEVDAIDATGGPILTDSEDLASARLVFRNGARANVTASRVSLQPMRKLRMFSSSSYVSLDFQKNYGLLVRKGRNWEAGRAELRTLDPDVLAQRKDWVTRELLEVNELELGGSERPLQAELDSFLLAVQTGRSPEVTGAYARSTSPSGSRLAFARSDSRGFPSRSGSRPRPSRCRGGRSVHVMDRRVMRPR
jgi:predicted dehydrogenase